MITNKFPGKDISDDDLKRNFPWLQKNHLMTKVFLKFLE